MFASFGDSHDLKSGAAQNLFSFKRFESIGLKTNLEV